MTGWLTIIADVLIIFGLLAISIAVIGMIRMPSLRLRLHAASLVGIMGTLPVLLAAIASQDTALITRALLIGVFLLFTMPVTIHVLARAAYHEEQAGQTPDTADDVEEL